MLLLLSCEEIVVKVSVGRNHKGEFRRILSLDDAVRCAREWSGDYQRLIKEVIDTERLIRRYRDKVLRVL